jgi:sulfotransferase
MPEAIHFISGLPRSGSTLLSAILRQNPRFSAGITSPVFMLCNTLLEKIAGSTEFAPSFDDDRRAALMHGIVRAYYGHALQDRVIFDTNRLWTGRAALLKALYPKARIICCVRDVGRIIDSLERMLRANPLQVSRIFNFKPTGSVYERAEILMNSETGLIGLPWSTLREAWFGEDKSQLVIVDYDRLVARPRLIIEALYAELGEPSFSHDFDNLAYDEPAYDSVLGMPGLHKVRPTVSAAVREKSIPPDIFARYSDASFWRRPEYAIHDIRIL